MAFDLRPEPIAGRLDEMLDLSKQMHPVRGANNFLRLS
jgi:hypothetical protein